MTGLTVGPHTFSVRASDAVGNVEETPATYSWTVAATETPVTQQPVTRRPSSRRPSSR